MATPDPAQARLLKAVRCARGFQLLFAEFDRPVRRASLVGQLQQQLAQPVAIHQLNTVPASLPDWLAQQLAPLARQHTLIHLFTPLAWQVVHQAERDTFFADLNDLREVLAQTCVCSVLFWLSEIALRQMALMAPDLWNWRSLVVDCSQPLSLPPERSYLAYERQAPIIRPQSIQPLERARNQLSEPYPEWHLPRRLLPQQAGDQPIIRNNPSAGETEDETAT